MKEKEIKDLEKKHYARMKSFLKYDSEGRDIIEQKIILEQNIKAAKDLLVRLKVDNI